MGQTLNDLASATPSMIDRGSALEVKVVDGALASIDDLAFYAGGNAAIIGNIAGDWEVFQFREANLIGSDTWALSHRLRGQRGTDTIMPDIWPAGSTMIVLDHALQQIEQSSELLGVPRHYRVGPASKPVDHYSFIELTHTNNAIGLRPYAPAHLSANASPTGDLNLTWIRRTRIDGDNWQLSDVPLGENVESYTVRVVVGTVLRREEVILEPSWTYMSANQAADGVTAPFTIEVAQNSELFGRGLFARMTINA
jgi:hypothetical protein